jgi:hypothetical protein
MLQELESTAARKVEVQAPAEVHATPAVLQMTSGLREYALTAAV